MRLGVNAGGGSTVAIGGRSLVVLLLAGVAALAWMNMRDIQRYLRIRNM